jgi:signal transduction histidine kinase
VETILVVDDSEPLRRLMVRALTRAGYAVLDAPSAELAIALAEKSPAPPQLLVTDLAMPGMGGEELAAHLTEINSGLRVLFTSGRAPAKKCAFLAKPFAPSDLVSRVRAMLPPMRRDHRPLYLALGLSALVFAVDVSIPGGYAVGALYLAALAFFLRSRVPWHALAHAGVATALTLADITLGAPGPDLQLTLVNRGISIAAIWLFALVLTRHQQAELRREEARRLFELALAAAPDGTLVTAPDERIVYSNAAAAALFGLNEKGLLGKRWTSLLSAPTDGNDALRRALRPDGTERPVECKLATLQPNGEALSIVVLRDVSERQRYEERLRATQRMEAIGKLAGGIAHDFNNVLSAIIGNAEFAKHSLPADSPAIEDLDELRVSADRAAALTRQLLAFSRRQVIEPIRVDVNELSRQTERMLARLLGEDIEIEQVLAKGLWAVEIDPSQLEQVLLNLAVNARDAMPKGGQLTIETQNVTLDDDYCCVPEVAIHLRLREPGRCRSTGTAGRAGRSSGGRTGRWPLPKPEHRRRSGGVVRSS